MFFTCFVVVVPRFNVVFKERSIKTELGGGEHRNKVTMHVIKEVQRSTKKKSFCRIFIVKPLEEKYASKSNKLIKSKQKLRIQDS